MKECVVKALKYIGIGILAVPHPNFDEFNFSKFTGIEPLFLPIIYAVFLSSILI
jgi:hypothetical protein